MRNARYVSGRKRWVWCAGRGAWSEMLASGQMGCRLPAAPACPALPAVPACPTRTACRGGACCRARADLCLATTCTERAIAAWWGGRQAPHQRRPRTRLHCCSVLRRCLGAQRVGLDRDGWRAAMRPGPPSHTRISRSCEPMSPPAAPFVSRLPCSPSTHAHGSRGHHAPLSPWPPVGLCPKEPRGVCRQLPYPHAPTHPPAQRAPAPGAPGRAPTAGGGPGRTGRLVGWEGETWH